jgi:multidrug efflux pump
MVVDDAIVVLENIHRHIEEGLSPKQAAIKGSREISFAVIAMTLTLAAVYTPVAFMTGRTGKLFTEFAITLAGAVVISGWLALTLSPVMCGAWLRPDSKQPNLFSRFSEAVIKAIETGYAASLRAALRGRFIIILIAVIVSLVGVQLLRSLKSELAPTEDRGTIVAIGITPEGSTIDYTAKWMRSLEPIFASVPEIQKYFVVAGFPTVSQGIAFVRLSPWEERNRTQMEIGKTIAPQMFGLPGMMSFPVNPPSLGRSARSQPIEYIIQTTGTYDELNSVMGKLMQEMQTYPGIANPDIDLKLSKPQLSILIARDKAAALGVQIDTIGRALETLLGGRQVTRFKDRGKQYDVIVQIEDQDRVTPSDIDRIYVRNKDNKMIPLSALLTITETVAPRELNHFNQMRSAKITANVGQGYTLGEALDWLDKKSAEILPASARTDVDGESREFRSTSKEVIFTFLLALGFIYLVLAAQFESYRYPLVILLTVPLSMTGALLALKLTGGTLNIYSQIGLITLIGLITKHGILIVEFSNQRVAEGLNPKQAVYEAATVRLRPVLMTTLAMVLGAVPLALSEGAGAESRRQIGWVIIGGMMIGTLFTLYVVPAIHSLVLRANSEKDNLDEKNFSQ